MATALVGAPLLSALPTAGGASVVGALGAGGVFAPAAGFAAGLSQGFSLLNGLGTAASAYGQIQAGRQEKAALDLQARQSDLAARQEKLRGKQQAQLIRDQLSRDLASQNALFAARGGLAGEGSAQAARGAATTEASRDIRIAQFDAGQRTTQKLIEADQYRAEGSAAQLIGVSRAIGTIQNSRTFRKFSLFE